VAVAIIAGYCFKLLRRQNRWWQWVIALGTLAGIVLLKVSAVYILLIIIVFAAAIASLRERRNAR
jgi:chromate transport protein ChrA